MGGGFTLTAVFAYGGGGVNGGMLWVGVILLFFGVRGWRRAKASEE